MRDHDTVREAVEGRPPRPMSTRRRWTTVRLGALMALLGAALLLVTACSDDDGDTEDGGDAAETPTATATTEATTATSEATSTATESATETATETPSSGGGTTVSVTTEGELAPYLVGPEGMTLYLFTNDTEGVSNCTDQCIQNWPPLLVEAGEEPTASEDAPGELGVIEREDGLGRQVTYNGIPLYYWQGDQAPGDTTGQGVGEVWFVVPPTEGSAAAISGGAGPGY